MNKIHPRNRDWRKEVSSALIKATELAQKENVEIKYLYRYAIDFVMKNRKIKSIKNIEELRAQIDEFIQQDWNLDEESIAHHKFHFVSAYLEVHVEGSMLSWQEGDRLLDYLNESMDLFD